jgi:hypothetical protein
MSNWCFNKLIVTGPDIPALLNAIGTQDRLLSFEKIVPMPDAIADISGFCADIAIVAAMRASIEKVEQMSDIVYGYFSKSHFTRLMVEDLADGFGNEDKVIALLEKMHLCVDKGLKMSDVYIRAPGPQARRLTVDNLAEIGNQYLENIVSFGALGWYDWCILNWGTKCDLDASPTVMFQDDHSVILSFDTAWLPPNKVIMKLGARFPEYKFRLTWHAPNTGCQGSLDVFGHEMNQKEYKYSEHRLAMDFRSVIIPARLQWNGEKA